MFFRPTSDVLKDVMAFLNANQSSSEIIFLRVKAMTNGTRAKLQVHPSLSNCRLRRRSCPPASPTALPVLPHARISSWLP